MSAKGIFRKYDVMGHKEIIDPLEKHMISPRLLMPFCGRGDRCHKSKSSITTTHHEQWKLPLFYLESRYSAVGNGRVFNCKIIHVTEATRCAALNPFVYNNSGLFSLSKDASRYLWPLPNDAFSLFFHTKSPIVAYGQ